MRITVALGAVASISIATVAQAQAWRPLASSDPATTAAGVEWPSGVGAIARCQGGRFQLLFTMPQSLVGATTSVVVQRDLADERHPTTWRLAAGGRVAFARHPIGSARGFVRMEATHLDFDGDGPAPSHALNAPAEPQHLAATLEACGVDAHYVVPEGAVFVNPDWLRRPDGADLASYVPREAVRAGVSGRVVMSCIVDAGGALNDCLVESEEPPGYDFGAAALAMAPLYRMRPQTVNGRPVEETQISLPIQWNVPRN